MFASLSNFVSEIVLPGKYATAGLTRSNLGFLEMRNIMKKRLLTAVMALVTASTVAISGTSIAKAKIPAIDEYDSFINSSQYLGYPVTHDQAVETLNEAISIASSAPATPHEKIKYFHDKICQKCTYSNPDTMQKNMVSATAYGALVLGKAKCVGYTRALSLLCQLADIPCREISGIYEGGGHVWNIVQLEDGEWYEVDCTFDDETSSYDWFLLTTEQISKDHKRSNSSKNEPIANGTLYAYNKKAVKVGNAKYKVTDTDKVEYSEATKSAKGNITIPDTVTIGNTTYEVTSIAKNAFKGNKKIKKVVIGKNIETIGSAAFSNCPNLKSVDMSKCRVTSISKNLYKGSKKLSKLSLNGDNVTSVGKNALKNIAPKCKITIIGTGRNSGLMKNLKKQGGKKCKYIFK